MISDNQYQHLLIESVRRGQPPKLTHNNVLNLIKTYVKTYTKHGKRIDTNKITASTVLLKMMTDVDIVELIMKAEEKFALKFPKPKKDIRTVGQLISYMMKSQRK